MKNFSKYAMLIATLLLSVFLFVYLHNLRPRFNEVERNYENDRAINLSSHTSPKELAELLLNNNYVSDKKDATFIADTLTARLYRGLKYSNLYLLQKRRYGKVPALVADSAGVLTKKLERSYEAIHVSQVLPPLASLNNNYDLQRGDGVFTIRLYADGAQDCGNAIIPLTEYFIDSLNHVRDTVLAYVKTDSTGLAVFRGLDRKKAYSVLPIKKGFEYGSSKGVREGQFKRNQKFRFEQLEHKIQMIDNITLKQIKNDGTITVRTPSEFRAEVIKWVIFVILAWWILTLILIYRRRNFDPVLIASAMFLTGLCVLVMFAIHNPLTEELRGAEMASGILWGIGIIIVFQLVDFIKFYQNAYRWDFDLPLAIIRWLFLPFKKKVSWLVPVLNGYRAWYKKLGAMLLVVLSSPFAIFNIPKISKINEPILRGLNKLPKGFGWLLLALFLTALLWTPLGREVGGMRVNLALLGFVFQPSEIAKYLILFFMAAFFSQRADAIINYSRPNNTQLKNKIKTLGWVLCGLIILLAMYAIHGDMGPGVVLGITFVLLYSLVKSKVNLDNLTENDKWKRIFTCDFAMLIYGIVSFGVFLIIGKTLGNILLFAVLWFVAWIVFGISKKKQFFETAFIINLLVFAFVFGGDIAKQIPVLRDTDTAERFEQRTRMCVNTWGYLDIDHLGKNAEPVSNTQVANGLWAIATGGLWGQGLGNGNANLIPAFHTDMILSSIAEQIGWWGLLVVILVLALLLRRIIIIGYRVGHPFAFYFCTGVAIVTAVQFFIIALGSSGMIPLTGITVPFLSYGRVSMILNLTALGVIISLSKNVTQQERTEVQERVQRRSVGDYNYPIAISTWTYIVLALFTICVWQYYAFWSRGNTLVHPAYVLSREGLPIIEYNPRIALLTKEMWAGNIYDRNGILIATCDKNKLKDFDYIELLKSGIEDSNPYKLDSIKKKYNSCIKAHTRRYYPLGDHLFFMLGDVNTGLYLNSPIGYMAESQHLSYLRDYDNTYYDRHHKPVKVELAGNIRGNSRYVNNDALRHDTSIIYPVRDYHELIKYLKTGIHGKPLQRHNKHVREGDFDLHLTIDAMLQTDMQNRLGEYVKNTPALKDNNLLRISVVVLDAENGDLLTSANYPLPNIQDLKDAKGSYSDNYKDKTWHAYTERDLGLTYQTMPGSTAKVMSAMAGLQKLGTAAADKTYMITKEDIIETGRAPEPHGYRVTMSDAIVHSSNCYFIHLVNDNDLYWALDSIYESVGVSLGTTTPYRLSYAISKEVQDVFRKKISDNQSRALVKYAQRIETNSHKKMNEGEWRWAWGQGYQGYELQASPLNMARVASAVINGGKMPYTQYILPTNKYAKNCIESGYIQLLSSASAKILKDYMLAESANQRPRNKVVLPASIGGKTGTPERYRVDRDIRYYNKWTKQYHTRQHIEKRNDGWYIFFVEGQNDKHPLAVAVRMERGTGSGAAVRLTKNVVLEALYSQGYMTR